MNKLFIAIMTLTAFAAGWKLGTEQAPLLALPTLMRVGLLILSLGALRKALN